VLDDCTAAQLTAAVHLSSALLLPRPPAKCDGVRLSDADALPQAAAGVHSDMLVYVAEVHTLTAEELSAMCYPLIVFWCVKERLSAKTLAQLARQVLSIRATEAQSERAASLARLIDAERRARLSPERLSAVTIAKSWAARRFADELPPALPASMMQRGGTSAMAAALAAMGGGGEAPARGELNRVDEGGISLAVIAANPAVINDYGEVDVAVAAQPMDGDDEPAVALAAPAAAGCAGGGEGDGGVGGDAARVSAHLHVKALLQEQRCASAGNAGTP
jgi:hypothetical protein